MGKLIIIIIVIVLVAFLVMSFKKKREEGRSVIGSIISMIINGFSALLNISASSTSNDAKKFKREGKISEEKAAEVMRYANKAKATAKKVKKYDKMIK